MSKNQFSHLLKVNEPAQQENDVVMSSNSNTNKDFSHLLSSDNIEQQPSQPEYMKDETIGVVEALAPNPFETGMRISQGDLEYALTKYKGVSPELASKVKQIADKQGLPVDWVMQDRDKLLEYQKAEDIYNSLHETIGGDFGYLMPLTTQATWKGDMATPIEYKYPFTMQYLTDRNNLIAAKDDVKALQELELSLKYFNQKDEGYLKKTARAIDFGFLNVYAGLASSPAILQSSLKWLGREILDSPLPSVQKAIFKQSTNRLLGLEEDIVVEHDFANRAKYSIKPSEIFLDNSVIRAINERREQVMPVESLESVFQLAKDGNYKRAAEVVISQAISNAPNSIVAMAGALTGNPFASIGIIGLMAGGMSYTEKLEQGGSYEQALAHSIMSGTAEGVFETIVNIGILKGIQKRIAKDIGKAGAKKFFKNMLQEALIAVPQNVAEEFLTETTQMGSDWLTGNDEAFDNYFHNIVDVALVSAVSGFGMGAVLHSGNHIKQRIKTTQNLANFDKLQEDIKQTKIPKENIENFIDVVNKAGVKDSIAIDNEAFVEYFQKSPEEFKQFKQDFNLQDLAAIQQYGLDVEIDSARLLAKYADSPITDSLKPHFRFGDDGISLKGIEQAEEILQARQDEFATQFRDKTTKIQDIPQLQAMRDEMILKGTPMQDAEAMLGIQLETAKTLSKQTGESVAEWFNRVNPVLDIGGEFRGGLAQTTDITQIPSFKQWFRNSKVVDDKGSPLVVYHGTNEGFDEFGKFKTNTGELVFGKGFYFTSQKKYAEKYSKLAVRNNGGQETIKNVYLSIKNPFIINNNTKVENIKKLVETNADYSDIKGASVADTLLFYIRENPENFTKNLIDKGFDGVIVNFERPNKRDYNDEYVVFSPTQIKSVDNVGTFDATNPNIYFQATNYADNLTTTILKDLEGKKSVNKQYILDATNRGNIKQVERDLIRQVLEAEDKQVDVAQFIEKVKAELLPLTKNTESQIYENISLPDNIKGDVKDYRENIYESPVKTSAGEVHFNYKTENYFGHTRIEDMSDDKTRRVIEVQSDLYQKGRLEKERIEITDFTEEEVNYELKDVDKGKTPNYWERGMLEVRKNLKGFAKLQQYNDPTAHFRMVREEVRQASLDGLEKLQFPTGETAMNIEGLGQREDAWVVPNLDENANESWLNLKPEMLRVGLEVNDNNYDNWIITDILGDGKFKAVPKDYFDSMKDSFAKTNKKPLTIEEINKGALEDIIKSENNRQETFDISGKVDTSNPIYKFYEKDLGKYLKNKYQAKQITDNKGVSWYEVDIKQEYTAPVEAFQKLGDVIRGSVQFTDTQTKINLFKNADRSTFLHESAHIFSKEMQRINDLGLGDAQFKADYDTILKFVDNKFDIAGEEKFARAFEGYLMEGKAPSVKLANAFDRFKNWLMKIYESIKNLDVDITDELRGVFDRMLASQDDIDNAKIYYNLKAELSDNLTLTKEQKKSIKQKIDKTIEEAQRIELSKRLKAFKEATDFREQNLKQARKEVENEQVYQAIDTTIDLGGVSENDLSAYLVNNDIKEINRKHPGFVRMNVLAKQPKIRKYTSAILELGGLNPATLSKMQMKELKEAGLFGVLRKNGFALDTLAQEMQSMGWIQTPDNLQADDDLWQLLISKADFTLDPNLKDFTLEQDYIAEKGAELLDVANALKYDNVNKMLDDILKADNKEKVIRELVKLKEQAIEQNILDDIQAEESIVGESSLHNEKSLETLIAEEKIMIDKMNKQKKMNMRQIEKKAIEDTASIEILSKPVREAISYKKYLNAEKTASNNVVKYLQENNIEKALEWKRKQLINHSLVKEANKYRDVVLKNQKKYQLTNVKKISAKLENAYNDVYINTLQDLGLIDEGKIKTSSDMNLQSIKDLNYDVYKSISSDVLNLGAGTDINNLRLETYLDLMDALKTLEVVGKDELSIIKIEGLETITDLVNKSIENMDEVKDRKKTDETAPSIIKGMKAGSDWFLNRAKLTEFLFDFLDNYKKDGVLGKVYKKLVDQEIKYIDLVNDFSNKIDTNLSVLNDASKRIRNELGDKRGYFKLDGVEIPSFDTEGDVVKTSWNAEKLVSYILNMGNDGNFDALTDAYGFTQTQNDIITSQFTSQELQAIQGIWDTIESFYPIINEVHFKLHNRYMDKVDSTPVKMLSKDGQVVELKGGYYPLQYDREISLKMDDIKNSANLNEDIEINRYQSVIRKVSPKSGFKEARSRNTGMPPLLSLNVLQNHIKETSLFVSHSEILNDINKLTLNKDWRKTFIQKQGKEAYNILRDYFASLSRTTKGTGDVLERAIGKLNQMSTIYNLTGTRVALTQIFSLAHTGREIGINNTLKGFYQSGFTGGVLGLNHNEVWQNTIKESSYMRVRQESFNDALSKTKESLKSGKGFSFNWDGKKQTITKEDLLNFYFMFLRNRDRVAVMITYNGAKTKYINDNVKGRQMTEADNQKAIAYAEKVVRKTQPSALRTDLNAFQRDKGLMSLWTRFMTYSFKLGAVVDEQANMLKAGKISKKDYANHLFQDILTPAIAMTIMKGLWGSGELPEPAEIITAPLSFLASTLPFVRDIPSAIKYSGDMGSVPAFSGLTMIVMAGANAVKSMMGERDFEDVILKDLVNVFEYVAGVPAVRNYRIIKQLFASIEENL